jgi:hypothetical protein
VKLTPEIPKSTELKIHAVLMTGKGRRSILSISRISREIEV